ncbi:DUF6255 family natural product biosynthesis protein [Streptomyces mobaraensis]|uniref:DUF6255 family natural product biosynthesis protein n=1 Tax=Streptomyces mobaraensis TaxID=35621 RepID=UPI001CCF5736|nr:DUF6255 family natural product biosynthesis protein [Streptomyces mobaraensis]UBI37376.1 hypothetical protein K7I03_13490 [Streptomyces mobaraensis]
MRAVGRLIHHCGHRAGWERGGGEERCRDCGARRFTDYAALLMPERPVAVVAEPRRDPRPRGPLGRRRDRVGAAPSQPQARQGRGLAAGGLTGAAVGGYGVGDLGHSG